MYLIDVSDNNGPVDFRAVFGSGIRGVWVKATEGASYVDPDFVGKRRDARKAGLRVGGYHFARPDLNENPDVEAVHFADVVGLPGRRDLRPVLDLEVPTDFSAWKLESWAHHFCYRMEKLVGVLPIFYSYSAYIEGRFRRPVGAGLWIANYDGVLHVTAPAPWKRFVAHQYTDRARIPGVHGDCDRSWAPKVRPLLAHPILGLL